MSLNIHMWNTSSSFRDYSWFQHCFSPSFHKNSLNVFVLKLYWEDVYDFVNPRENKSCWSNASLLSSPCFDRNRNIFSIKYWHNLKINFSLIILVGIAEAFWSCCCVNFVTICSGNGVNMDMDRSLGTLAGVRSMLFCISFINILRRITLRPTLHPRW